MAARSLLLTLFTGSALIASFQASGEIEFRVTSAGIQKTRFFQPGNSGNGVEAAAERTFKIEFQACHASSCVPIGTTGKIRVRDDVPVFNLAEPQADLSVILKDPYLERQIQSGGAKVVVKVKETGFWISKNVSQSQIPLNTETVVVEGGEAPGNCPFLADDASAYGTIERISCPFRIEIRPIVK